MAVIACFFINSESLRYLTITRANEEPATAACGLPCASGVCAASGNSSVAASAMTFMTTVLRIAITPGIK
ncbi:MAG: hypothetical protein ACXWKD_07375 [Caldimonas sp.]